METSVINKVKNKIIENKENLLYVFITIFFIILSFIIAKKNEPWADEAHAWLLARDTDLVTLFTKYLHTEGHPALWHIVLKGFQAIGGTYELMYILPIIF